jgi:hypothetical protein
MINRNIPLFRIEKREKKKIRRKIMKVVVVVEYLNSFV